MGKAMRHRSSPPRRGPGLAAGLLALLAASGPALALEGDGDEPRGLGKIFRLGRGRDSAPAKPAADAKPPATPPHDHDHDHGREAAPRPVAPGGSGSPFGALPPGGSSYGSSGAYRGAATNPYGAGNPYSTGADGYNPLQSTPGLGLGAGAPAAEGSRLVPQPRVSRPLTDAPPILTRVSIGRSDNGQRFGMFLQIHADGTVLSSDGVSRVGPDVLRPLLDALRAADLGREREHCGGPPTDFIEQVHLTVYDQSRGRLVANQLTYSGNTQGCDPALAAVLGAIDAVQNRIASPAPGTSAESAGVAGAPAPGLGLPPLGTDAAPPAPLASPAGGPTVGLTPYP
jgi:hypothetical protein